MFSIDRLKYFIKCCYKTQVEFGQVCDLLPQELSRYTTQERKPGADILAKFSNAGLNLDWLFTGNGSMYANNEKGKALRNIHNPEFNIQLEKIEKIKELINEL
jgi:hypothetical protein